VSTADLGVTRDRFLNGAVTVVQPAKGYRAGMDAVLLAASLSAKPGESLAAGADIVITGRVADPSLVVAPCIHHFGWDEPDLNKLAGATVAGHPLSVANADQVDTSV